MEQLVVVLECLGVWLVWLIQTYFLPALLPIDLLHFSPHYALSLEIKPLTSSSSTVMPTVILRFSRRIHRVPVPNRQILVDTELWAYDTLYLTWGILRFYALLWLIFVLWICSCVIRVKWREWRISVVMDSTALVDITVQSLSCSTILTYPQQPVIFSKYATIADRVLYVFSSLSVDCLLPSDILTSISGHVSIRSSFYVGDITDFQCHIYAYKRALSQVLNRRRREDMGYFDMLIPSYESIAVKASVQEIEGKLLSYTIPSALFISLHSLLDSFTRDPDCFDDNTIMSSAQSLWNRDFSHISLELSIAGVGLNLLDWYYIEARKVAFEFNNDAGQGDDKTASQIDKYCLTVRCVVDTILVDEINYIYHCKGVQDYVSLFQLNKLRLYLRPTYNKQEEKWTINSPLCSWFYEHLVIEEDKSVQDVAVPDGMDADSAQHDAVLASVTKNTSIMNCIFSPPILHDNFVLHVE